MHNERGAGRKPKVTADQLSEIKNRINNGESITGLAAEYGVSRQALHARLKAVTPQNRMRLDYYADGKCTSQIWIDVRNRQVEVDNLTDRVSAYAFGIQANPSWTDFELFLEQIFLESSGVQGTDGWGVGQSVAWIKENGDQFALSDLLRWAPDSLRVADESADYELPVFHISKRELLYARTDTDGFQLKALSKNRKWFVKAQAIISGTRMDDWKVEIMASELCRQLGIPCVQQRYCEVVYAGTRYDAVYSRNFELDGFEFVSFESLIARIGASTYDAEFIKLDAIGKLEWCAKKLSLAGELDYQDTLKYMIDLALIDCLVGNVDRHTRNFGLFFDSLHGSYQMPLIFDNGMGLLEHDPYARENDDFESAMRNVYVSPYGEDPFDMIRLLNSRYNLKKIYPALSDIAYPDVKLRPLAQQYIDRMVLTLGDL